MIKMEKITKEFLSSQIKEIQFMQYPNTTATICNIELKNGFSVRGESACINSADFNVKIGQDIAKENAFAKLWELYGFARMEAEYITPNSKEVTHYPHNVTESVLGFLAISDLCIKMQTSSESWESFSNSVRKVCKKTFETIENAKEDDIKLPYGFEKETVYKIKNRELDELINKIYKLDSFDCHIDASNDTYAKFIIDGNNADDDFMQSMKTDKNCEYYNIIHILNNMHNKGHIPSGSYLISFSW